MIAYGELPKLQGTERQIEWAERIRAGWISEINTELSDMTGKPIKRQDEVEQAYREVLARPQLAQAGWWIRKNLTAHTWIANEVDKMGAFNEKE